MHFSIGFVAHDRPRRAFQAVCGGLNDNWKVDARLADVWKVSSRYTDTWNVTGYWPREDGLNMSCECEDTGCIKLGVVCAPQGDDTRVLISVYDTDGDEFDISGATEIVFLVAAERGGVVYFTKRLSLGQAGISTNGYQFWVDVTAADSVIPIARVNYYEVQVTTSAGLKKTVSAGSYIATKTAIKDLP